MFAKSKSVVGLDIGSSAIKAVELSQKGRDVSVSAFGQIELASEEKSERARAIRELLAAGGFRTKRVITSVSGKNVIVRYLNMVRMSDEELRNAIVFEAEKYVPFPLEECIVDCQRIDGTDDARRGGNMMVLLVAVRKAQMEEHLQTVIAAGFTPETVDIDALALGNAYALCQSQAAGDVAGDSVIAFVDVGAAKTSINIVSSGTSLFTREIGMGGNDFTQAVAKQFNVGSDEAEQRKFQPDDQLRDAIFPAIDDLGNEVHLSFDYFEDQFQKEISKILLSGGSTRLPFFQSAFERIFEKPTTLFNPFTYLKAEEGIDADLLSCNASQLVTAVGLAARLQKV